LFTSVLTLSDRIINYNLFSFRCGIEFAIFAVWILEKLYCK